ncbi:MAG: alpha/beta fold hydrolase [Archangium sp.]
MAERLDDSKTAAFTLGPSLADARVTVVLLHGFTGSPWEVRPLGEALAARGARVVCPRLPGHGTTPEAMLWAGHHEWLAAAQDTVTAQRGARRLVLCGLSMGALLSMIISARRTQRVDGLVLMAPVLEFHGRDARLLKKLRFLPMESVLSKWVKKESTDIEDDEIRAQSPILPRYPLARAFDLMELQALAREAEARIGCPSLVLAARNDHVVDSSEVRALSQRLSFSRLIELQRGFHIIPRDTDRAIALTEISHFVEAVAA